MSRAKKKFIVLNVVSPNIPYFLEYRVTWFGLVKLNVWYYLKTGIVNVKRYLKLRSSPMQGLLICNFKLSNLIN